MLTETFPDRRLNPIRKSLYFAELYLLYFLIALRLRRYGMKKSVTLCTSLRSFKRVPGGVPADQFVLLIRDLARSVINWHFLPTSCVPDSLLICWFLARRGIKADFVIIVRHFPFMAHAQAYWKEMLLTDPPPEISVPGKYVTLMRK
jgi:hypothetical protein